MNGRGFGKIAIGLGALALLMMLFGRGHGPRMGFQGGYDHGRGPGYAQQERGPQSGFEQGPFGRGEFGRGEFGRGEFGRAGHHGPGFLMPLFFLNALFKLAGLVGLVLLILSVRGRWRNGGPRGPHDGPHGPPPASPTGETYTGETRNL